MHPGAFTLPNALLANGLVSGPRPHANSVQVVREKMSSLTVQKVTLIFAVTCMFHAWHNEGKVAMRANGDAWKW